MADRNTISQVIESLFEDWIDKNISLHPLAVENMRLLEADALDMLKAQEPVEPMATITANGIHHDFCGKCGRLLPMGQAKFCSYCGQAVKWE